MEFKNYTQQNKALGSQVVLTLISPKNLTYIEKQFTELWAMIDEFEKKYSRFILDSELSTFNRSAGTKQYVSNEFKEILTIAKDYGKTTNGLFNIFILPALQNAGYTKSFLNENKVTLDDFSARTLTTTENLKIGPDWALIPLNTAIDLGGIGKGYLANKLSQYLDTKNLTGYSVSLGGDIVINGKNGKNENWEIDILKANSTDITGKIVIPTGKKLSVATSGITKRKGVRNGKEWHHIIDPRTRSSADTDIQNITICTQLSLDADILATCAVILGTKNIDKFLLEKGIHNYLIQYNDSKGKLSFKTHGNLIELYK